MGTLTIQIGYSAVVQAVKGDTYITSSVDRGADSVKNAGVAYNEAAGDDGHHEKKIDRLVLGAVSKFASELAEFVDSSSSSSISIAINESSSDKIIISLPVTTRYSSGLATPLSGIAQEYIVNMALYGWWISIKPEMAKNFAALAADALIYVRKCFAKKAPSSTASYSDVTGNVVDERSVPTINLSLAAAPDLTQAPSVPLTVVTNPANLPLTYTISDNTKASVSVEDGVIMITGLATGAVTLRAAFAGNGMYMPGAATLDFTVTNTPAA